MQLAAATAAKGTNRPTSGGKRYKIISTNFLHFLQCLLHYLDHLVQSECRADRSARRQHVRSEDLLVALLNIAAPVRVVDERVKGLIQPLPEDDRRGALVERDHSAGDKHVHGHLGGHATD